MIAEITYALIKGGIVENNIVADADFAALIASQYDAVIQSNGTDAYIGGAYQDGAFVPRPADPIV